MMTRGSPVQSSAKSKQIAFTLILLMIFSQLVVLIPSVGADTAGTPTLRTTFSNGNSDIVINLEVNATGYANNSAELEIPQNTTVGELSFSLHYSHTTDSPGDVWLDIDQDGLSEWEFGGTGYGGIGNQTRFSDDSFHSSSSLSDGMNPGQNILLPKNISVHSSSISIDYSPQNSGIWYNDTDIVDLATVDIDDDNSVELLVLSPWESESGPVFPEIGWVNNNSNNDGFTSFTWLETCPFSENLEITDFNGDGYDDVLTWTPIAGRFCYHLWNPSANNYSAANELLGGNIGEEIFVITEDINGDGFGDIVYADTSGNFGYYQWKSNVNGFELIDEWDYLSVSGLPPNAVLKQFAEGNILTSGVGTLVFVSDQNTLDTLVWDSGMNEFILVFPPFSVDTEFLWLEDLNGDSFDDMITWGNGSSGNILVSNVNNGDYGLASQSGLEAPENASIVDFDGDGGLDILIPENATGDNNDLTIDGSLLVYNFMSGSLTNSTRSITPRTMPSLTTTGDMNGDGHSEIIVYCGETYNGIFIDSWHKMEYDFDGDGIFELDIEGFAQAESGPNGSQMFRVTDSTSAIAGTIDTNLDSYNNFSDGFGIEMMNISSQINLLTAGTVSISNFQITYSFDHHIEELYDGSGNKLSDLINNNYMEFGTQTFTVPLTFGSSSSGELTLDNLRLVTFPGHPDLPDLDPLVLMAIEVLEDSVELRWSEVSTGNQYFSNYELYRTSVENGTFPTDYSLLTTTNAYTNVSYNDTDVLEGGHYEYVVRTAFNVGALSSSISNVVVVNLPSVPRVENISASDTPMDQGGTIDINWDRIDDKSNPFVGYYDIYVFTQNFSDTTLMDPVTTLQHTETTFTASFTSAVRDSNGDIVVNAASIENEQALWAAVVATNDSGSNPYVSAVGPVYALNNDLLPTQLSMDLTDLNYLRENLIAGGNPTTISFNLKSGNSAPFEPVEGEIISTTIIVDPDGDAYEFNFNSTTDSQGDTTLEFNWRDLANQSIGANGGEVEITAVYEGRIQTLEKGPLEGTTESIDAMAIIPATFTLNTPSVMVDEFGDATLEVSLIAENDWQQAALTDLDISFKYYFGELLKGSSTQQIPESGILEAYIDAMPEGGHVLITPDNSANPSNPNALIYPNTFELNATLYAYDGSGQTNLDQDADGVIDDEDDCENTSPDKIDEVDENGCSPDQLENILVLTDLTLDCPVTEWTIQNEENSVNSDRECLLINDNDFFVEIFEIPSNISVEWGWIGVSCSQVFISSLSDIPCTFSPTVTNAANKTTSDPLLSSFTMDITYNWNTLPKQDKTISYVIDYWLIGDAVTVIDDNNGGTDDDDDSNNNGNSGNSPVINEESADSKAGILDDPMMLGLIAGGAIVALVSIVIIVRFIRGDDDDWDDDWEDDDDDDDMENPLDRILGRTSGGGYDSMQQSEEEPFERTLSRGRLSGAAGQEFVKQSQQSNEYEDDPGYSVDEDGTEWWEDEQGQWWYRDPNMDDWEEWNE